MKKLGFLFVGVFIFLVLLTTSCDVLFSATEGYNQGYESGADGYSLLGYKSSDSACDNACENLGYSDHKYYSSTGNCFCK